MGDFGIVVVPRDGADTQKIINHSSVLRKHKVGALPSPGGGPSGSPTQGLARFQQSRRCGADL